ncbi:DEAD/DEAH box helicase [Methanococcus maripaludis]|uniref:AAA family ATPase n=1 Tax=Methanococcus maripaludis TaxID=39152 RepID=A0A8T3W4B0_METMI|nr:AAA domain-containing protein [Methanococcus maripaludis]MBG0768309.1 AAA family ATPase [Methanococcus maripaludis]
MDFVFNKSSLKELAHGKCYKKIINDIYHKNCESDKNDDYLIKKGLIKKHFIKDRPRLEKYTKEGYNAEITMISEISKSDRVVTSISDFEKNSKKYKLFFENEGSEKIVFQSSNSKYINFDIINPRHFNIDFSKQYAEEKVKEFLNLNYNYAYQFNFKIRDDFYFNFLKNVENINFLKKYKDQIKFSSFTPDLIKIINPVDQDYSSKKILGRTHNIIDSKNNKIKLKIYDIKNSDVSKENYTELGIYIIALNTFLFENGLDKYYEVVAEACILKSLNEDQITSNSAGNYLENEYNIDFISIKRNTMECIEEGLVNTIKIIENGDAKKYNSINITERCRTCDYYGGQYTIQGYLDKENQENNTQISIDEYYNNPDNNYCRYTALNSENINKLYCCNSESKITLLNQGIDQISDLKTELSNPNSELFSKNIAMKSNKEEILNNIYVASNKDLKYKIIPKSKTLNVPKFSNLTIYLEERHDSQNRTLCLAYAYSSYLKKDGVGISDNSSFKDPYIAILDDPYFSKKRERREFLDFLIDLNTTLTKFEEENSDWGIPTYSIIYWGENCASHFKDLLLDLFNEIMSKKDMGELYRDPHNPKNDLSENKIREKKKELNKLILRFENFFKQDGELQDYRMVEKSPFFNLKKGIDDIVILDTPINNTLFKTCNCLFDNIYESSPFDEETLSNRRKKLERKCKSDYYYKPDSDYFKNDIFSTVWSSWGSYVERKKQIDKISKQIKYRLTLMKDLHWCNTLKGHYAGVCPNIPLLSKEKLFEKLNFGSEVYLLQKLESACELLEVESNYVEKLYKKTVLGSSIYLNREVTDNIDEKTPRKIILDKYIKNSDYDPSEYLVYEVHDDSKNAKYDEKSFGIVIYPKNKSEWTHKKFSTSPSYRSCIYIDKDKLPDFNQYSIKKYSDAFKLHIEKFDRFNKILILKIDKNTRDIMDYLSEKEDFDFTQDLILENTHVDIWSSRLKDCLDKLCKPGKLKTTKKILEDFDNRVLNNYGPEDVKNYAKKVYGNNYPLDDSQINAITNSVNNQIALLWGPPGTGKTHTISNLINYIYETGNQRKILIMGSNYDSVDNVINNLSDLIDHSDVSVIRLKSKDRNNANLKKNFDNAYYEEHSVGDNKEEKHNALTRAERFQIFTGTPHQVYKMFKTMPRGTKFKFDNVIVDEASQMSIGYFLPALLQIHEDTQFLLAGDHLQLPPISRSNTTNEIHNYLGSVFDYYRDEFEKKNMSINSLYWNRRSNKEIVGFIREAFGYDEQYMSDNSVSNEVINYHDLEKVSTYDEVLDPKKPMVLVTYDDGNSNQINDYESKHIVEIIWNIWKKGILNRKCNEKYGIYEFFDNGIGIAVPHRAQRTLIQEMLLDKFSNELSESEKELLNEKIISSVDTVEKYQGQQREIMICGYVVGNNEIISKEEEFIYSPNRLNVMISRARYKTIVFTSNELLKNVSDSLKTIELQKSLKILHEYCNEEINNVDHEIWDKSKNVNIRYRSSFTDNY